MRTHLRVTAAALIFVGLATGCSRTTEGSVAQTTEPGPPIEAPTRTPTGESGGPPHRAGPADRGANAPPVGRARLPRNSRTAEHPRPPPDTGPADAGEHQ